MRRRSRRGIRRALDVRDYRLLLAASTASQTGDWLYNVALVAWAYEVTRSAGWVAVITIVRLAPYPVFGPLGGLLADTFDRRRVLIVSDVLRGGLVAALAVVAASDGPVGLAVALAGAAAVAGTAYRSAVVGMLPDIVGERSLAAANALESMVESVTVVVGPMVGVALLVAGSPALAFAVNAVTFFASAIGAVAMRTRSRGSAADQAADAHWIGRLGRGFHELASARDARVVAAFLLGTSFVYGAQSVMLVLIASEHLRAGPDGVGVLYAALGVGGLLGAVGVTPLARSPRVGAAMLVALAVNAVPMAAVVGTRDAASAFALVLVSGIGMVVVSVLSLTQLQRSLPGSVLGRVWGALDALTVLVMIVGSLVVGPTVATIGRDGAFVALMVAVPTLGLAGLGRLLHADREAVALLARIGGILALLEQLPIFEHADRSVLERLALSATVTELPIGADAIVQGEPATHFFVIQHGRLDVLRTDGALTRKIAVLGAGDWFGEIGLLHDVPRNATVRARWPSVVWTIEGAELLDAVSAAPTVSARLLEGVATRLGAAEH